MTVRTPILGSIFLSVGILAAQQPAFEVASVKPSPPGGRGMSINRTTGGRITTENVPLRFLITFAFDVRDFQVTGGPGWIAADQWDISAKPDSGVPPGPDGNLKLRAMMRSLLADRFKLVVREEIREMPVYGLVVAKSGSKLQPSPEGSKGCGIRGNGVELNFTKCALADVAQALSNQVGRTVIDETGIKGDFDLKIQFAPEQNGAGKPADGSEKPVAVESEGPSIFTAIQEKLGLRLESKKGPVKIIVIEQAERATEN